MPISNYLNTSPALGDRVYLHPSCQVIGDVNRIVIGRGTNVQDLTVAMCRTSHPKNLKTRR